MGNMAEPNPASSDKGGHNTEKLAPVPSQDRSDMEDQVKYEKGTDEALKFVGGHAIQITEEAEKRVRRKIDLYILPW